MILELFLAQVNNFINRIENTPFEYAFVPVGFIFGALITSESPMMIDLTPTEVLGRIAGTSIGAVLAYSIFNSRREIQEAINDQINNNGFELPDNRRPIN